VAFEKGATARSVIAEMRSLAHPLTTLGEEYESARTRFEDAIDAAGAATQWVVDTYGRDPRAVAAVAVPYLKLMGTVLGGALMCRSALVAHRKLRDPESDGDFLSAKLVTARHFCEHVLPQANALGKAVLHGSDSVLALSDTQF
jgi:acyl-CoA dehydrogenase